MSELPHVDELTFPQTVLKSSQPVLVEFGATWCGPCKMLAPVLADLAQEWSGKAAIFQVDVDQSANLAVQYQVMSVPTVILFVGGQPVERLTGYQPKDRLVQKFGAHF
jgi:thioredoxin 1